MPGRENLTESEEKLVEEAGRRILKNVRKRRNSGLTDVIYSFVLSETGKIYSGKPFESNQPSFNFCAERAAINRMQYEETENSRISAILVAGPVPEDDYPGPMPCGACRHAIFEFGDEGATVIVSSFIREGDGEWNMFPNIRKFSIEELYPEPYEPIEWE